MRVRSIVRWYVYLFVLVNNILLLSYSVINKQKGGGIERVLHQGVAVYYNDDKPKELIGYMVGVSLLFAVFIVYVISYLRGNNKRIVAAASSSLRISSGNIVNYMHIALLLVAAVGVKYSKIFVVLESYVLVYLVANMYGFHVKRYLWRITAYRKYLNVFAVMVAMLLTAQVVYVFYNHIFERPRVINEYFNLPETTYIGSRLIDNTEYINDNGVLGVMKKWDINYAVDDEVGFINIKMSKNDPRIPRIENQNLYYDEVNKKLYLNGVVEDDVVKLYDSKKLYEINESNGGGLLLNDIGNVSRGDEMDLFNRYNGLEIHWQVLDRYMFHHHSFILNPVMDLELGKYTRELKAQYGLGNIYVFRFLMDAMGGVSLNNWLRLSALFYCVYYIVYVVVLFSIFDNKMFAVFVFALSIATLNMIGYEFIVLAPGNSPWRHIFDVQILLLLFIYSGRGGNILIAVVLLLSSFSIFMNPEIGLMISVSVMVSLGLFLYVKSWYDYEKIFIFIIAIVLDIYILINYSSRSELSEYYLKGVLGFKISTVALVVIFGAIILGYALIMNDIKAKRYDRLLIMMYLFVYSQCLAFYYVWHADDNGLLSRSHIYVLTGAVFCENLWKNKKISKHWSNAVVVGVVVVGIMTYINSFFVLKKQMRKYGDIFRGHKVYYWEFERAKIESTVDPECFKDAVEKINKYTGNNSSVCMISRYDNILLLLASKYTIMPMQDMKWYCVTDKEFDRAVEIVRNLKPEYIYVDSDISRNYNNDIIRKGVGAYEYLVQESVWRAERLKILAKMFSSVSGDYELVEKGRLISVYKKK